jgi:hypothetical protein
MLGNLYIYLTGIVIIGFVIYVFTKLSRKYSVNPFMFYNKVKNGYLILSNSLYHNCHKKDFEEDLKNILRERTDGRYLGGYSKKSNEFDLLSFSLDSFYDLLQYNAKREQTMILDLNKGVSLEKLNAFFINSLGDKLEDKSFITKHNLENSSFPYSMLLSKYQRTLNKNSIQIGFFTDYSDSNYLFIFPSSKEKIVKAAIADIGFEYKCVAISTEKVIKPVMARQSKQKMAAI